MTWLKKINPFTKKLQYSVASHRGPREENQDNYLIRQPSGQFVMLKEEQAINGQLQNKAKSTTQGWWRFAVMDGMGGHANGREISQRLAELLSHAPGATDTESLKSLLLELHDTLYQEFHFLNVESAPGTTLVIAEISPDNLAIIGHVGDSRAYLQTTKQNRHIITQDHTANTFAKRLNPQAAVDDAPVNQALAQALGFGSFGVFVNDGILHNKYQKAIRIDTQQTGLANDIKQLQLRPQSQLLLASDGIWHTKTANELPLPETIHNSEILIANAINAGALDNMTAIVIDVVL